MTTEAPTPLAGLPDEGDQTGVMGALLALAIGVGLAALVDFGGIAGQGFRAGQMILAVAPWILVWRSRKARAPASTAEAGDALSSAAVRARALRGNVPAGWVLLLAGSVAALGGHLRENEPNDLTLLADALQASGAAAVLLVLFRAGRFRVMGLLARLGVGAAAGAGLAAFALSSGLGWVAATAVANVLVAIFLVPQLAHDALVVRWGRRTGEEMRTRLALEGLGGPFILWTLAGHLIIAPARLYFAPKPEVFVAGVAAAVALALFGLRGLAGLHSKKAVAAVISVATVYGVGLAIAVIGDRPYAESPETAPPPSGSVRPRSGP
jgi:hypothetical protein